MKNEMRNEIEKFVTAKFGTIESGRKNRMNEFNKHPHNWNMMLEVEKIAIEKMGKSTKDAETMLSFYDYLKNEFGTEKTKLLLGMIGTYDIYGWTGYMILSEDKFKEMTVKELKADIEELYEEEKFNN